MFRYDPLVDGEFYHVYNRGAHKQAIFLEDWDYRRFQLLMFLLNNSDRIVMRDVLDRYKGRSFAEIYSQELVDQALVDVVAYCLMPNHFHLVLRQKAENGISQFMKKLGTGYSMYFNAKYDHSGVVTQGRYKNKHIGADAYFRWIFAYVHLNPLDIFEPGWKEQGLKDIGAAKNFLNRYAYSSHFDYQIGNRQERKILAYEQAPDFLTKENDVEILCKWLEEGEMSAAFA